MKNFKIAAAQSGSVKGESGKNVDIHLRFIEEGQKAGVDVMIFPELSLTGYEPGIAKECALAPDNPLLQPLKEASRAAGMMIVAGCPLISEDEKPWLGALIFIPDGETKIYRKKYLHGSEVEYFTSSNENMVVRYQGKNIGMAICADTDNPSHAKDTASLGADIYAAGMLITPEGIEKTHKLMSGYASKYRMTTLFANHNKPSSVFDTGGKSAIWNEAGEIIVSAKGRESALVIAEQNKRGWTGKIHEVTI